jgi:hypothetical protein
VFPFDGSLSAQHGLVWLLGTTVAAFIVSWVVTDIAHVRRTPYVAFLALVTAALTWSYLSWSGAGASFWSFRWAIGIVGGVVAGAVLVLQARKIPRSTHADGAGLVRLFAWEDVVYGAAEGVLLSVLPVAMAWQVARSLGWTETTVGAIGWAAAAVAVSLLVVAIHHLGYWEFRGPLMRYPVTLCGVLSIAYVVTGSPIAPILGHIAFHAAMTLRGAELPPRPQPSAPLAA